MDRTARKVVNREAGGGFQHSAPPRTAEPEIQTRYTYMFYRSHREVDRSKIGDKTYLVEREGCGLRTKRGHGASTMMKRSSKASKRGNLLRRTPKGCASDVVEPGIPATAIEPVETKTMDDAHATEASNKAPLNQASKLKTMNDADEVKAINELIKKTNGGSDTAVLRDRCAHPLRSCMQHLARLR